MTILEFKWTTSRARDSYGYNVCTLYADGVKVARCNGGGYDLKGTCYGDWIARAFRDRLLALTPDQMAEHSHYDPETKTRVDDGRGFYGLTFHDPTYDLSSAIVGTDTSDRTLSHESQAGKTVAEVEAAGVSFGLERYQAIYTASSPVPTVRHTVPSIDGACGFSSVETIATAIGLTLVYVPTRSKSHTRYQVHDGASTQAVQE